MNIKPQNTKHEIQRRTASRFYFLIAWPIFFMGYLALTTIKGPATEGFGVGGYAYGILSAAYGFSLYLLNRTIVYTGLIQDRSITDIIFRYSAIVSFAVGVVGFLPMLFILMIGIPYSIPGFVLVLVAVFRWRKPNLKTTDPNVL